MLPLQIAHLVLALCLAIVIALAAYAARALTLSGVVSAVVVGTVIAGIGGWSWAAALLTFFVTSSALSRWRKRFKETLAFEKTGRRDVGQVWANGGVATVCVLLPLFPISMILAHLLFLAALAAANADTWATEIGAALGGTPFLITTGRRVPPGASGAVSVAGILAALLGAALLGLFAHTFVEWLIITFSGWGGALFDSFLGATVQAQWRAEDGTLTESAQSEKPVRGLRPVRNDAVNLLCTLVAVALAACFQRLMRHSL